MSNDKIKKKLGTDGYGTDEKKILNLFKKKGLAVITKWNATCKGIKKAVDKLEGNNLSIAVNRNKDGSSGEWRYAGKLSGNQLDGSFSPAAGKKVELIANRQVGSKRHLDPSVIN